MTERPTALATVGGAVAEPGVVEVELGPTLGEVVEERLRLRRARRRSADRRQVQPLARRRAPPGADRLGFVASGLELFAPEIERHRRGTCGTSRHRHVPPIPDGYRAELLPELVEIDEWATRSSPERSRRTC